RGPEKPQLFLHVENDIGIQIIHTHCSKPLARLGHFRAGSRRLHIEFSVKKEGVFERRRDTLEAARTRGVRVGAGARYYRINAAHPTVLALSGDARTNRGAILENVRGIPVTGT